MYCILCNLQSIALVLHPFDFSYPHSFFIPKLIALHFAYPNERTSERMGGKKSIHKMVLNFILLNHVTVAATTKKAQHATVTATTTKMDGSLIRRNVVNYLNEQCPIIAVHFIYHTVASLKNGSAYRLPANA